MKSLIILFLFVCSPLAIAGAWNLNASCNGQFDPGDGSGPINCTLSPLGITQSSTQLQINGQISCPQKPMAGFSFDLSESGQDLFQSGKQIGTYSDQQILFTISDSSSPLNIAQTFEFDMNASGDGFIYKMTVGSGATSFVVENFNCQIDAPVSSAPNPNLPGICFSEPNCTGSRLNQTGVSLDGCNGILANGATGTGSWGVINQNTGAVYCAYPFISTKF